MRVLHISTSSIGGAGTAAIRASDALNTIGVDSRVLHIYKGSPNSNKTLHPLNRSKIDILKSKSITILQKFFLQKNSNLLTPISMTLDGIQNELIGYDVVHLHSTYNVLGLTGIKELLTRQKVFVTLHDQRWFTGGCHYVGECIQYQNLCSNCPQGTKLGKHFVRENFKKELQVIGNSSLITYISPSTWLATQADKSRLLSSKQIHVLHNPIPTDAQKLLVGESDGPLMTNQIKTKIGFIAENLQNPLKGLNVLIDAWKLLNNETRERLELVLVGNNPPKKEDLPERTVVFSAESSEGVRNYLRDVDLLVVPSYQDNLPNVIGEAYALGKKVIGSRVGGIPEIITSETGEVFECGNSIELALLIEKFDINYSHKPILDYFELKFGYEQFARRMIAIYSQDTI